MSALYSLAILRLATGTVDFPRLEAPDASVERRSRACGSVVIADVRIGDDGRIAAVGFDVTACAVGQAAVTIVARAAVGRKPAEVVTVKQQLRAYFAGESDTLPSVNDLDALAPVRDYPARHDAALLAFDAIAACVAETVAQGVAA